MTCLRPGWVGSDEMMRWRSLISSRAVSVYRGADLTTLRATWRFILMKNEENERRASKGYIADQGDRELTCYP